MNLLEGLLDVASSVNWILVGVGAVTVLLTWQLARMTYNVFFHPLRNLPGPFWSRASPLPWAYRNSAGVQAFRTQKFHEQYGPVVRIGPDHVSFTDPRAFRDIYGHRVGAESHRAGEMAKAEPFVRTIKSRPTSIIDSGREEHAMIRRALAHGFSDASMREQEPMIVKYVDLLLGRLRRECAGGERPLNLEAWYNWTTFDIAGDLIFGISFGCLDSVEYHPWISFIFKAIRMGSIMIALSYIGLSWLVQLFFKVGGFWAMAKLRAYTDNMVTTRLNMEKEREDLFEGLVKRQKDWNLSFEKLSSNAFILVLAGSETTATTLSGATYLLLSNPKALKRVTEEVRLTFKSADEITINSVGKLTYMLAVLNETLRMYPPVTSGLVRVVPEGGEHIAGQYVPGGIMVEVQQWSVNHSTDNWADPWVFNPERFLGSTKEAREAGNKLDALNAFSVGPRNCIGRNLAYAEMRLVLARIVYEFDMTLLDDSKDWIKRQRAFSLWDRIPLNVRLTPV